MAGCLFCFTRRRPFGAEDRSAAVLLQPHIADALRSQSRRDAERLLTGRQRELLRLVAAGHDNTAIARQLGLSPGTVRKHLENAFARLDVSTRTAAVAKVCPDAVWSDPARENDVGGQVVMSGQESHSTGITHARRLHRALGGVVRAGDREHGPSWPDVEPFRGAGNH